MKILITGATGFIGKNLTRSLKKNHSLYVLHRSSSDTSILPKSISKISLDNSIQNIIKILKKARIDGTIHLASSFIKDHDINNIDSLIDSNVKFGAKVLECCTRANIDWFINTGSYWQHYKNEEYNPVNLYAATKQAFEDIAKYYIETSEIKFVTLKLFDTFGPNDTRSKIFNLWNRIAKTGENLKMSPGEQIIDITYIDNVIAAYESLVELISKDDKKINGNCYALQSKSRYTLKELAKIYENVTGYKLNIEWGGQPYRKREVMLLWENGEEIPGYEEKVSVEEGIERIYSDNEI